MWTSTVRPLQGDGEGHPLPGQPFTVGGLNQWETARYGTAPPSQSSIRGCILAPCDMTSYPGRKPSPNICPAWDTAKFIPASPGGQQKAQAPPPAFGTSCHTEHTGSSYRGTLKGKWSNMKQARNVSRQMTSGQFKCLWGGSSGKCYGGRAKGIAHPPP